VREARKAFLTWDQKLIHHTLGVVSDAIMLRIEGMISVARVNEAMRGRVLAELQIHTQGGARDVPDWIFP
jgi:hypothetical protein